MARNRAIVSVLPLAVVLVVAYMAAFPKAAPLEYELERQWLTPLAVEDGSREWEPSETVIPFRIGDTLGYITPSGELRHTEEVRYDVAMSSERYANFGPIVQNLVLQDPSGRIASSLGPSGYPVFIDESLYTIDGVGNTLSSWDPTRGKQWTRTFPSLITALAAEDGTIAVGLLSGEVVFVRNTGEWDRRLRPEESDVEAIYGLSMRMGLLGVVSGQEPQRLTVYWKGGSDWNRFLDYELDGAFSRPMYVHASPSAVFVDTVAGVAAAFAPDWELVSLPVDGLLVSAETELAGAASAFVAETASGHTLFILDGSGDSILESRFLAADVWLASYGGGLLLGRDQSIVRIGVGLQ